ncbi:MAG: MSMEG_1061 family FMN-dependent PPOX-type flavoprotein [Actinomycetota bacterium]
MTDPHAVTDLRSIYREPGRGAVDKVAATIGLEAGRFIQRSPLFIIASTDGATADASPRGGPPGFVVILDEQTLAFADLTGNNRLDTFTNFQHVDAVGMIFIVPGAEETVRVNGRASLTTDEDLRQRCAIGDRLPKVAVRVEVEECYLHCGAALRRAALWDHEQWPSSEERPSGGTILAEVYDGDIPAAEIDAGLDAYYDNFVWEVGGGRD